MSVVTRAASGAAIVGLAVTTFAVGWTLAAGLGDDEPTPVSPIGLDGEQRSIDDDPENDSAIGIGDGFTVVRPTLVGPRATTTTTTTTQPSTTISASPPPTTAPPRTSPPATTAPPTTPPPPPEVDEVDEIDEIDEVDEIDEIDEVDDDDDAELNVDDDDDVELDDDEVDADD